MTERETAVSRTVTGRRPVTFQPAVRWALELVPDAVVAVDAGGRIVLVNDVACRVFGYEREELVGRQMEVLLPERLRSVHRSERAGFMDEGRTCRMTSALDLVGRRKDGTEFPVDINLRHVVVGCEPLITAVVRDVTERRRVEEALRESERQLKQAEVLARLGSWRFDSGTVTCSDGLYRVYGLEAQAAPITYDMFLSMTHPEDRAALDRAVSDAFRSRGSFDLEYRIVRPDGSVRWVEGRGETSDRAGMIGTVRDITERKQIDGMKDAFLNAVSHELRTPLAPILGFGMTLARQDVSFSAEQMREMATRIVRNAERLEGILNDLLDMDRLRRGVVEPARRPVDIGALVRRVAGDFAPLATRPFSVECDSAESLVDRGHFERIVENLLSNAVRHTPAGTPLWISVTRLPEGVMVKVEDAGDGVPDDLKKAIFALFNRGRTPRHVPGTGIGLSLVARFAEINGGQAWVEDRPGGGASFRVLLPPAPVREAAVLARTF